MNWQVFTHMSTIQVQIHWVAAVVSMVLGIIVFSRRKGNALHKLTGRLYVIAMLITSVSAIFIGTYGHEESSSLLARFSWIHLLIPFTLIMLTLSIVSIRKGNVKDHKRRMILTYLGGIVIAGSFTFIPGRHMHSLFFAAPVEIQQKIANGIKH